MGLDDDEVARTRADYVPVRPQCDDDTALAHAGNVYRKCWLLNKAISDARRANLEVDVGLADSSKALGGWGGMIVTARVMKVVRPPQLPRPDASSR